MRKGVRIFGRDSLTQTLVRLFNPSTDAWYDHFEWSVDGIDIIGKTPVGRATVAVVGLNRPAVRRAREIWRDAGWHPPQP